MSSTVSLPVKTAKVTLCGKKHSPFYSFERVSACYAAEIGTIQTFVNGAASCGFEKM